MVITTEYVKISHQSRRKIHIYTMFKEMIFMQRSKFVNVCYVLVLSVVILSFLGADSASAGFYDFVNHSGRTIKNIYLADSEVDTIIDSGYRFWGPDLLVDAVLPDGNSVRLYELDLRDYFDIKVVWMDDSSSICRKMSFKGMWKLTLYEDEGEFYMKKN